MTLNLNNANHWVLLRIEAGHFTNRTWFFYVQEFHSNYQYILNKYKKLSINIISYLSWMRKIVNTMLNYWYLLWLIGNSQIWRQFEENVYKTNSFHFKSFIFHIFLLWWHKQMRMKIINHFLYLIPKKTQQSSITRFSISWITIMIKMPNHHLTLFSKNVYVLPRNKKKQNSIGNES